MKIERAVGEGSTWNYKLAVHVCTELWGKLSVFLHKLVEVLRWWNLILTRTCSETARKSNVGKSFLSFENSQVEFHKTRVYAGHFVFAWITNYGRRWIMLISQRNATITGSVNTNCIYQEWTSSNLKWNEPQNDNVKEVLFVVGSPV